MGRQNPDSRDLIFLLPTYHHPSSLFVHSISLCPSATVSPLFYPSFYSQISLCIACLPPLSVGPVLPGFFARFSCKLLRKMSKAGPLTRSVSKRPRPAEPPADNNNHAYAVQAPSNPQSTQPRGGLGGRLHSDEIVIGLALGSPRQNPLPARPPDDRNVDDSYVCSSLEKPASTLRDVNEIGSGSKGIKRKGSKWKSLSSLFGRREVRSAPPFYQLDQNQQPEPAKQLITQDYLETNALRRKRADSNHGNKAHPVDPSTGMPGEESNGLLRRNSSRRRGLRRRKVEELQPELQRIPAKYTTHAIEDNLDCCGKQQGSRMPGPSLLQVEIPCVELERYSVMFGDVLKPQVWQSKPQPSLLARRHAHLEELHTVADSNSKVRSSAVDKSLQAHRCPTAV